MLLFAPASIATLDRLASHSASLALPRHLQLLATLRAASFEARQLQHWLPGAGLDATSRANAIWHATRACLPPVGLRLLDSMGAGCAAPPRHTAIWPPLDTHASALQQHVRQRVQAQQTIAPQVPMQHLLRYLQHHVAYCEGAFRWLLYQREGMDAQSPPDRLALAHALWRTALDAPPDRREMARLRAHAHAVCAREAGAINALSANALLCWQIVLAECAVAVWEEGRDAMPRHLASLLLHPPLALAA